MKSNKRQRALIKELVALFERYSPEEVEQAAAALRNGEVFTEISELAIKLSKGVRETKSLKSSGPKRIKKTRRAYFEEWLNQIKVSGDEFQDLVEFLSSVQSGVVLHDRRSLRSFTNHLAISGVGPRADRFVMLKQIGEVLRRRLPSERAELIEFAKRLDDRPSSLQGWSDLIVKK